MSDTKISDLSVVPGVWEATAELRWMPVNTATEIGQRLQQKWVEVRHYHVFDKDGPYASMFHATSIRRPTGTSEWRDVPTVSGSDV